jgi:exoribonuclease R
VLQITRTGTGSSPDHDPSGDLYIPRSHLHEALHGDRVAVRQVSPHGDRRRRPHRPRRRTRDCADGRAESRPTPRAACRGAVRPPHAGARDRPARRVARRGARRYGGDRDHAMADRHGGQSAA